MHLTTTGAKHMTKIIRTALAISSHPGTSNTNLTAANGHSTSTGTLFARNRFAISIKSICSHRAHSTTAIDVVYHMTAFYQHSRIATHNTSVEVEVSLTISSNIGIRTATRTIDITTVREASTCIRNIIGSVVWCTTIVDNL